MIIRHGKLLSLLLAAVILAGCSTAPRQSSEDYRMMPDQMSGLDLFVLLEEGNRFELGSTSGTDRSGTLTAHANGTVDATVTTEGDTRSLFGTWEVVGPEFCHTLWGEEPTCERWVKTGDTTAEIYTRYNGQPQGTISW